MIFFRIRINKITLRKMQSSTSFMQKQKQKKPGKRYAFLNAPCFRMQHVYSERDELNGVEFKSKQLVLEEAKTRYKDRTPRKQNSPDHQYKSYYLNITHQHEQQQEHQHRQQQHQQQHKQYNHQK